MATSEGIKGARTWAYLPTTSRLPFTDCECRSLESRENPHTFRATGPMSLGSLPRTLRGMIVSQPPSTHEAAMSLLRDEILQDVLAAAIVLRTASEFAENSDADGLAVVC